MNPPAPNRFLFKWAFKIRRRSLGRIVGNAVIFDANNKFLIFDRKCYLDPVFFIVLIAMGDNICKALLNAEIDS